MYAENICRVRPYHNVEEFASQKVIFSISQYSHPDKHVCRPSLLCNRVIDKIDNNNNKHIIRFDCGFLCFQMLQ